MRKRMIQLCVICLVAFLLAVSAYADGPTITFSDTEVYRGDTAYVTMTLSDLNGVSGLGISFAPSRSGLTLSEDVMSNAMTAANPAESLVAMLSMRGLPQDTVAATFAFEVAEDTPQGRIDLGTEIYDMSDQFGTMDWSGVTVIPGSVTVLDRPSETPAPGAVTEVPFQAAACTEDGHIQYWEYNGRYYRNESLLDEVTEAELILPALGHSFMEIEPVAATCGENGMDGFLVCMNEVEIDDAGNFLSGLYLENEDGSVRAVSQDELTIYPATGEHDYSSLIPLLEATDTMKGIRAHYTCTVCGQVFDENKAPTTMEALEFNVIYGTSTWEAVTSGHEKLNETAAERGYDRGTTMYSLSGSSSYDGGETMTDAGKIRVTLPLPEGVTAAELEKYSFLVQQETDYIRVMEEGVDYTVGTDGITVTAPSDAVIAVSWLPKDEMSANGAEPAAVENGSAAENAIADGNETTAGGSETAAAEAMVPEGGSKAPAGAFEANGRGTWIVLAAAVVLLIVIIVVLGRRKNEDDT